ncbi:MAG: helix-turn-helix transcriptional regulator, partial [Clostridia bacterium]|nr:helix-turn-helix transcriptional regulator [Clostridia bacterium]
KLAFMEGDVNGANYMNVYDIMRELEVYKKLENEFDNIYIYFYNSDYCISLNSAYVSDVYYETNINSLGITKGEWIKSMLDNQDGKFAVFSSENEQRVTYFYSVYGTERFVPYATIAIEIDGSKFLNNPNHPAYNKNFYIYDGNGIFLADDESKMEIAQLIVDKYGVENGIRSFREDMTMIAADSDDSGWKYFYLVDKSVFVKSVNTARLTIAILNLIGICIMLLVALFLVRFNYNPIKNILNIFGGGHKGYESEFQYIQDRISSVISESREINRRVKSIDNDLVREAVLSRLMSENLSDAERDKMIETLVNVGVLFPHDNFAVMLIYIEINLDMFFDNIGDAEENYRMARVAIINVFDELLAVDCNIYYCNLNGSLCCVTNLKNGEDIDGMVEKIKWIQRFAKENFNIDFMVGISNAHSEIEELGICLGEATECVKERFYHSGGVICYNELETGRKTEYCLPNLMEEQLVDFLRNGNLKGVFGILDGLFDYKTVNTVNSVHALKCILYNLVIVINRAFGDSDKFDYENVAELVKMIEELEYNSDIDSIRSKLYLIIENGCAQSGRETTDKMETMLEKAKAFVDEQYMDINMSVTAVAQHMDVSLQYMSTNFKKRYRIGLAEYITLVRIEHAKELLTENNMTIAAIAESVGYVNARSFFRSFMRIVGTSPKEYRNMKR